MKTLAAAAVGIITAGVLPLAACAGTAARTSSTPSAPASTSAASSTPSVNWFGAGASFAGPLKSAFQSYESASGGSAASVAPGFCALAAKTKPANPPGNALPWPATKSEIQAWVNGCVAVLG